MTQYLSTHKAKNPDYGVIFVHEGATFHLHVTHVLKSKNIKQYYWRCSVKGCKARFITQKDDNGIHQIVKIKCDEHLHPTNVKRRSRAMKRTLIVPVTTTVDKNVDNIRTDDNVSPDSVSSRDEYSDQNLEDNRPGSNLDNGQDSGNNISGNGTTDSFEIGFENVENYSSSEISTISLKREITLIDPLSIPTNHSSHEGTMNETLELVKHLESTVQKQSEQLIQQTKEIADLRNDMDELLSICRNIANSQHITVQIGSNTDGNTSRQSISINDSFSNAKRRRIEVNRDEA